MSEYIVDGAEPNSTVLKSITKNGYEHEKWLPVRERIVRCRDCEHYFESTIDEDGDGEPSWCTHWAHEWVRDDGFCAWGEKKVDA